MSPDPGEEHPLLGEPRPPPQTITGVRRAPLTFSCSIRSPCLRMFFLAR